MGKRSSFKRRKHDAYYTPYEAVLPLLPHLGDVKGYIEPCAGNGTLINHLERHGITCLHARDIAPRKSCVPVKIYRRSAFSIKETYGATHVITNPVWSRPPLHKMIEHFRHIAPTWLLFDADWGYTLQKSVARQYECKTVLELMRYCHKTVAVGRVSWMGNGKKGKDNCAWYLFKKEASPHGVPLFYPKAPEVAV